MAYRSIYLYGFVGKKCIRTNRDKHMIFISLCISLYISMICTIENFNCDIYKAYCKLYCDYFRGIVYFKIYRNVVNLKQQRKTYRYNKNIHGDGDIYFYINIYFYLVFISYFYRWKNILRFYACQYEKHNLFTCYKVF
jgi:hypothetical protein